MPTVMREFARAKAGEVGVIAAGVFSSGELLTAVRNGSDNLELIVWKPDTLDWGDDSGTQAGEVGEIALAMLGGRCVTAVQNANGKLLLIPWALEPVDKTISRLENVNHQAGKATYLTIAPLSSPLLLYATGQGICRAAVRLVDEPGGRRPWSPAQLRIPPVDALEQHIGH
jgi:hypothetical protein